MGRGREVADAYISVHGDLGPFRRDLDNGIGGKAAEDAAIKAADTFGQAWAERLGQQVNDRWNSIVDSLHTGKKIDFDRMFENFDSGNFDEAQQKLNDFLDTMHERQKISLRDYTEAKRRLNEEIDGIRAADNAEKDRLETLEKLTRAHEAANKENERWARTLDGIRKTNTIGRMEEDFKRLAAVMNDADMAKFSENFESLEKARARIYEVTAAMEQQGRITAEQAEQIQIHANAFVDGEKAKAKAMREALEETKRLKDAQDRYNASLSGMARSHHFGKLENDFRNLAAAMDSQDWSHFERGARSSAEFRRNIAETAAQMRRLGRATDQEYLAILQRTRDLTLSAQRMGKSTLSVFDLIGRRGIRFRNILAGIGRSLDGTRKHLAGYAGLNVFSDMIRGGLDFIQNLDRIALRSAKVTAALGTMANLGGASLAGLVVIAGDLGATLGGLAAAAPAFLIGSAIGIGVLVAAFKDTKTVLKDLKKPLADFQDAISADFWKEAAQPIRDMANYLLPILNNPEGTSTARSLGKVFGSLADAIKDVPKDDINFMFDNMNNAIENMAEAMPPLVRAFNNLGKAGSKQFGRFSDWLVKLSTDFDNFIQQAADSGALDRWIENMISGFKDIGRAIDGTFGIFNALESAARKAGSGGLKEFADNLQGIAATMQSARFQTSLTLLFSGMRSGALQVGQALKDIGPAIESFMPSLSIALDNIGKVGAEAIRMVGGILENPTVQKGVRDFTGSMVTAMEKLQPAVQPFADSLGHVMTLLGQVLESVADITTAFMVELSPELDKMSAKSAELLEPLRDMAKKVIAEMKPVLESFNTNIVNPVVDAMNSSLIPAIDDFVAEAGPFLEKVIKELGPGIKILVDEVLPNMVKFATELVGPLGDLVALLSPTFADGMQKVADGFETLTDAMKVMKGEMSLFDLKFFDGLDPAKIKANADEARETIARNMRGEGGTRWRDVLSGVLWGEEPDVFWSMVWERAGGPALIEAINTSGDDGGLDDTVNQWLEDNVVKPFQQSWDDTLEKIGKIGEKIKEEFQRFLRGLFGFGFDPDKPKNGAVITGSGGKGMGVSGTLDPAMFGLPSEEGTSTYFNGLLGWAKTGMSNVFNGLGETLGLSDFGARWDGFWTGVGTTVDTAWTTIGTWITTKAGEIKTNIDSFTTDVKTNWDSFWDGANTKATEVWDAVRNWTSTKAGEVKDSFTTFTSDTGQNWTGFWDAVNTKATDIWGSVKSTVSTRAGEVQGNFSSFTSDVKNNWDNFWTGANNKVGESWRGIQSGAETGGRNVSSFFGGLPQTLQNAMGDVFSKFSRVGNSIASGMQSGINAGIEWVKGAAARVAEAAVNAAKWVLEVNSPSKVFRRLGLSTGEGFVQGFDWSESSVAKGAASMASVAVEAFAGSKMYLAGADAALGLADGLKSQKSAVLGVLNDLTPDANLSARISASASGAGAGAAGGSKSVVMEPGAVQVITRASDPGIVANTVTDSLDEAFSKFSTL